MSDDDRIHGDLYAAIVQHSIPPATRLTEDTIAEIYGVSRTIVRKALQRLAGEGLVVLTPNRGAAVAEPTVQEARNVFEARRILEREVVAAVARKATPGEIDELRSFGPAERSAHDRGDRRTEIRLSGEFHLRLAHIMGNETIAAILRTLISRTSLIIAVYQVRRGSGCHFDEHQHLVERIAARDEAGAVAEMLHHLNEIEDTLDLVDTSAPDVDLRSILVGSADGDRSAAPLAQPADKSPRPRGRPAGR